MDSPDGDKRNSRLELKRENDEICEHRGRVVGVPVVVKPVVVPVPLTIIPVQVLDVQVAVRVAESCAVPSAPPSVDYSPD